MRKDGRWCAYLTSNGRRIYHYARTQRACMDWLNEKRPQLADGLTLDADRVTLTDYLTRWLDSARRGLSPSSARQYEGVIRRHITPGIGKAPLGKLRGDHIQAWYSNLQDNGTGVETIHVIHAVLSRSLRQAVRWGLLARSPALMLDLPRRVRREVTALTLEQVRTLLEAARGHPREALFTLAVATGMRHGELLGLRWSDVDWTAGILHVQRQWTGRYVPVKSKRPRSLPLGPETLAALRAHQERQKFARLETDVIFCNASGTPLDRSTTLREFYALLESAGLPRVRFHDLRHTAATLMLEAGVHPKVVQERLGHASIAMTLDTYSHVTPSLQREAADALDARIAVSKVSIAPE